MVDETRLTAWVRDHLEIISEGPDHLEAQGGEYQITVGPHTMKVKTGSGDLIQTTQVDLEDVTVGSQVIAETDSMSMKLTQV